MEQKKNSLHAAQTLDQDCHTFIDPDQLIRLFWGKKMARRDNSATTKHGVNMFFLKTIKKTDCCSEEAVLWKLQSEIVRKHFSAFWWPHIISSFLLV